MASNDSSAMTSMTAGGEGGCGTGTKHGALLANCDALLVLPCRGHRMVPACLVRGIYLSAGPVQLC